MYLLILLATLWSSSTFAATNEAAALLSQMASIYISPSPKDALLEWDVKLAQRISNKGKEQGDLLSFLSFSVKEAQARRTEHLEQNAEEIKRFISLETRLLALDKFDLNLLSEPLKKNPDNPLLVLSLARAALQREGDKAIPYIKNALLEIDPGGFEIEWFLVARELTKTKRAREFLPFFQKGFHSSQVVLGSKDEARLSSADILWILYSALGEDGERAALDFLSSSNPLIKRHAAILAGSLLVERAIPKLTQILEDRGDPVSQIYAARSLGTLLADSQVTALEKVASRDANADVRAAALSALGEIAVKSSNKIIVNALSDTDPVVRKAAATALARYSQEAANVATLERVASKDPLLAVRQAAISALSISPLTEATVALGKLNRTETNPSVKKAIETGMRDQIVHASRGTLAPQFGIVGENGEFVPRSPDPAARAAITKAVDKDGRFSAGMIAKWVPGLERKDIPTLKRARQLVAQHAPSDVLVSEMLQMTTLTRSLLAK
jgi:HEAT repeat protein